MFDEAADGLKKHLYKEVLDGKGAIFVKGTKNTDGGVTTTGLLRMEELVS
jgi:hypothetical protein